MKLFTSSFVQKESSGNNALLGRINSRFFSSSGYGTGTTGTGIGSESGISCVLKISTLILFPFIIVPFFSFIAAYACSIFW